MGQSEQRLPHSIGRAVLFWIGCGSSVRKPPTEYSRIFAISKVGKVALCSLAADGLSNSELRAHFSALSQARGDSAPSVLMVGGYFLEDQVSRFCLQSLAEGYDTHLLCDAVFPYDRAMIQTHVSRLVQAGVVPSSINQMASFIIAETDDEQVIRQLRGQITLRD